MPMSNYAKSLAKIRIPNAKFEAAKALEESKLLQIQQQAQEEADRKAAAESEASKVTVSIATSQAESDAVDFPDLMNWIYSIPYSRRLSFVPSDFSDGVLIAEIVKHFVPELIDMHNYRYACGRRNKLENWEMLNRKVFPNLGFKIGQELIEQVISPKRYNVHDKEAKPYPIEKLLKKIQKKLGKINETVFDYRKNPNASRDLDPFKKKDPKRIIRPMSRQPDSGIMWRIERQEASKYGEYKGNPIIWDSVTNTEAEIVAASVGVSKQKFYRLKEEILSRINKGSDKEFETENPTPDLDNQKVKVNTNEGFSDAATSKSKTFQDPIQERVVDRMYMKQRQANANASKISFRNNIIKARYCPSRSYAWQPQQSRGKECFSGPSSYEMPTRTFYDNESNFDSK